MAPARRVTTQWSASTHPGDGGGGGGVGWGFGRGLEGGGGGGPGGLMRSRDLTLGQHVPDEIPGPANAI